MRTGIRYRELLLALILLLAGLPALSFGAEIRFQSNTLFRLFERDTVKEANSSILPGYEYLQIDAGELDDYGISFHAYGWGRLDFTDNDYFDDRTAGELLYGYLEYRRQENRCSFRLGRQYVFEGVANEAIDGLRVSGDLGEHFSLSLYGGQPVGLDSEDGRSGDSIYGGRLAHRLGANYEVGVSYKTIENDDVTAEELLGIDLGLFLPANLSLSGYSTYNTESEGWAEHSYELRIPAGSFVFKPFYHQFTYEDYFDTGANAVNPFRALAQFDEELTAYGLDANWRYDDNWTFGGKLKLHDYDQREEAQTYSITFDWQGEEMTQYGGELGRTVTDSAGANEYTLVRLYGYCEAMAESFGIDFVSSDLVLAFYDDEIYGEDSSLFVSLTGGKRFLDDALAVKISGDYSQDPYFEDDLRGMLIVSYNFAH
ncbi:MAG TPA: hypothetical protein VJ910_10845 [Desulfuromonadales bacterium]|nr:hypothetical protein [Desulfuromonadales bacterium]